MITDGRSTPVDIEAGNIAPPPVPEPQPVNGTSKQTSQPVPDLQPDKKPLRQRLKELAHQNLLVLLLMLSLFLGIIIGALLRTRAERYSKRERLNLRLPGEILLNMLHLLILPLLVSSLISGLTSKDVQHSGPMGLRTIIYFVFTTLMSAVIGVIIVISFRPGYGSNHELIQKSSLAQLTPTMYLVDFIRQMVPSNMIEATFQTIHTEFRLERPQGNSSAELVPVPYLITEEGINMLGLTTMSLATALAINHMGQKADLLKSLFSSITQLTIVFLRAALWYSPIGILFLVVEEIVALDNPKEMLKMLSYYMITVILGLTFHGFFILPVIYLIICRKNPFILLNGMMPALLTALGTSSSMSTLPITMEHLEKMGIDREVVELVAPIGAVLSLDGTALFEAVAVIFIAQVENYPIDIGKLLIIILTSTLSGVMVAGVPQAGLISMVIVLTAVGIPSNKIGFIFSIDWLLDRFRTCINVMGDIYGAGVIQQLCIDDLQQKSNSRKKSPSSLGPSSGFAYTRNVTDRQSCPKDEVTPRQFDESRFTNTCLETEPADNFSISPSIKAGSYVRFCTGQQVKALDASILHAQMDMKHDEGSSLPFVGEAAKADDEMNLADTCVGQPGSKCLPDPSSNTSAGSAHTSWQTIEGTDVNGSTTPGLSTQKKNVV